MSALTATQSSREIMRRQMKERRFADQAGRIVLLGILVVTAVVYIVMPIMSVVWMVTTPFMGVFLEYPHSVSRDVTDPFIATNQIGTSTDLRQFDEIIEMDGRAVSSADDVYRTLRDHYQIGDKITMQVVQTDGSTRQAIAFVQRFPLSPALGLFVLPYIVGLLYLAIGMWVYRNRRDQALGRVFLMLCSMVAIAMATTFNLWTVHILTPLWSLSIPVAGGLLMTFGLLFPNEPSFAAERPLVRYVPGVVGLLLGTFVLTQLGLSKPAVDAAWNIGYYYAGAGMAFFIVALILRGIYAPSPSVREQSWVVLVGTLMSFVPFLGTFVLNIFQNVQIGWTLAALLFFPLVIAYSIVQYSVLDTGRGVSFTATYVLMGIVIVGGYWAVVAGLSLIGTATIGSVAANPVLVALLAFALVIGFQPLRTWLQTRIDNYFFRTRGEYQERLTAFRHDLTIASGLGEVIRLLKRQIYETLKPTHAYVFLRDPGSNTFVAAGEGGRPDTDIRFEPASGLIHKLSTTRDIIFLELNKPLPTELVEEHARLAVLRTPVLAALQGQERLAGFVAVGNKRSGEAYATDDLRFVQALGEQASLAVERAQVIGDLERRVRELDVLSQVSQAVNFTTDPDFLMELIYAQAGKLIDATNFYIIMHNTQIKALSYAFFLEGDERIHQREGDMWPDNEGLASEVVRLGRPILTQDYTAECAMRGVAPGESRHYAWMGVPLNAGSSPLGVMVVASYTQGVVFTEEQLKVFWAIADQAASALDKARLFREIETRARQLATLNEISKELSSTLELENLLIRIMKSAVEILGAEAGSLFLIDDENGSDLIFRVVEGGAQNLVGTRIPSGKGIVGEAVDGKQPVIVNNVLQDRRWFSNVDRETAFQTQSLLAVPLLIQDRSIGVVEVINKKDETNFTSEDAALLTTFAAQAAVAIDNARLYEATDAELEARVDELQNLQRIDRELNRTLQYDRVIKITLDWALRTTGASAGAIAMINLEKNAVEVRESTGYSGEFLDMYRETGIPLDKGMVGRVLASGKPEFAADVRNDADFVRSAINDTVSQITAPILRANQPIGVLVLESHIPDLLSSQDFEFIQRLVEHAAVAIENARLVQEIESANNAKTEFISFVSHELKNPMTSIRGYTDLLKAGQVGPVTDMQAQFLGTIRTNVDRMTRLVSDLADVARIESGHLKLEPSPIKVKDVVDEVLRAMQAQITEKGQELILEIPEDLPPIFADHTRMVQVMLNLLSNAYKYTPDGGKIVVGARPDQETDEETGVSRPVVHHYVKDTGIGMSPEDMEKLFTKFFRTQRGKDMAQGTGLGLNITKNLVERHQGRVWVESEVGQGTTFHYTVPVATEEMAAEQASED